MIETKRTYCGLCHPRCGLLLELEDGRAVKVTGDTEHPVTRGRICTRGKLMLDHVYHPNRLNYPLKRKGARGVGQWERVEWEQALDEISEKLSDLRDKDGPESLTFTHGTKRTYHWDERRFFNLFGSPNICGANNSRNSFNDFRATGVRTLTCIQRNAPQPHGRSGCKQRISPGLDNGKPIHACLSFRTATA